MESNIRAPVLLCPLNLLRKRDKISGKPRDANNVDPDRTPQKVSSNQGLRCLLNKILYYMYNEKTENYHTSTLKTEMDWNN